MSGTKFSMVDLANTWSGMFARLLAEKKLNPINSYKPTPKYIDRKPKTTLVKLNIACGTSIFPHDGWRNFDLADFDHYFNFIKTIQHSNGMPDHQRKLWEFARQGGEINYAKHNMTEPFNMISDNSVDFIYSGQSIEHINYVHQAPKFVLECFRMLKSGGILRLTTPDLLKILTAYHSNDEDLFDSEQPAFYKQLPKEAKLPLLLFGASGEHCTSTHYEGHFFIYTEQTIKKLLSDAGFVNIDFTWPKCGKNKQIAEEIEDFGWSHSLIVEGVKP